MEEFKWDHGVDDLLKEKSFASVVVDMYEPQLAVIAYSESSKVVAVGYAHMLN